MNDYLRAKRQGDRRPQKYIVGYRPVVRARKGLMLGIRQPLDGAVFQTREEAENYCIDVMTDHFAPLGGHLPPMLLHKLRFASFIVAVR